MTDSDDLLVAYQHGAASMKDRIRELEAALTEALVGSLADLGQAQDALEAQKKAEAERDKLRVALEMVVEEYDLMPSGLTLHSINAHARPALGETEND